MMAVKKRNYSSIQVRRNSFLNSFHSFQNPFKGSLFADSRNIKLSEMNHNTALATLVTWQRINLPPDGTIFFAVTNSTRRPELLTHSVCERSAILMSPDYLVLIFIKTSLFNGEVTVKLISIIN